MSDELTFIMTASAFYKIHQSDLKTIPKGTFELNISKEKPILIWEYPGGPFYREYASKNYVVGYGECYEDENGNIWEYAKMAGGWVCLNAPRSTEVGIYPSSITATEPNIPQQIETDKIVYPTDIPNLGAKNNDKRLALTITAILIGALVIITVIVIILIFGVKKKGKAKANNNDTKSIDNSDIKEE